MASVGEDFRVIGVERQGPAGFGLELRIVLAKEVDNCQPAAGIGVLRIEMDRLVSHCVRPADGIGKRVGIKTMLGQIDVCQERMGIGIRRVALYGCLEAIAGIGMHLLAPPHGIGPGAQNAVIGVEFGAVLFQRPLQGGVLDLYPERRGDGASDLVLDGEDVGHLPVEVVGPEMSAGGCVDQLTRDADPAGGTADAALDDVARIELFAKDGKIDFLALEAECRSAANNKQITEAGEIGEYVFGEAVCEIFVELRAQVVEGQNRNNRLLGQAVCCSLSLPLVLRHEELKAAAADRLDEALTLAAIAEGLAGGFHAAGNGRLGDNAAVPDLFDDLVAADDTATSGHEVGEEIEDQRLQVLPFSGAPQLKAFCVQLKLAEPVKHRDLWKTSNQPKPLADKRFPANSPRFPTHSPRSPHVRLKQAALASGTNVPTTPDTALTVQQGNEKMSMMTNVDTKPDYAAIKMKQNAAWASGDYGLIGVTLQLSGEQLAETMDMPVGADVLDVAAGNGNITLAMARRGAHVTSTDYVDTLLAQGRARSIAEGLSIEFQTVDAEDLPFDDASFDAVVSTFGVMFTPNQKQSAGELLRVARSGGKIGMANWTPSGFIGQLFKTLGKHVAPPAGVQSPANWGTEDWIANTFGAASADIAVAPRAYVFRYATPQAFVDFFRTYYGPVHKAFLAAGPDGQAALEADILATVEAFNTADDGSMKVPSDYLELVITKA